LSRIGSSSQMPLIAIPPRTSGSGIVIAVK
jgi:hypothetical protein